MIPTPGDPLSSIVVNPLLSWDPEDYFRDVATTPRTCHTFDQRKASQVT